MIKNLILTTAILLVASFSFSQSAGNEIYQQNNRYKQNTNYNADAEQVWKQRGTNLDNWMVAKSSDNEMKFTVSALKNVTATSLLVIFNITQSGKTPKQADSIVNLRLDGFYKEVEKHGVKPEDIFTDMVALVPLYSYSVEKSLFSTTYNEVPSGFEMQKNLHIKISDEKVLGKIVTAAAQNEIYDMIKIEYFVKDADKVYEELQQRSIDFLAAKLERFKKLNIDFDTIYHILSEKSSVAYPVDRYRSYQAFSGTAPPVKNSGGIVTTSIKRVRKPKTMFYNKLPYHNYDIVINPEILSPAVQYTYSLTIKYVIKEKKREVRNQYKLVTPEGVVKVLKLED